jgi:hypothetical protein
VPMRPLEQLHGPPNPHTPIRLLPDPAHGPDVFLRIRPVAGRAPPGEEHPVVPLPGPQQPRGDPRPLRCLLYRVGVLAQLSPPNARPALNLRRIGAARRRSPTGASYGTGSALYKACSQRRLSSLWSFGLLRQSSEGSGVVLNTLCRTARLPRLNRTRARVPQAMLHRFVHRRVGGFAAGMRFGSLRRRYAEEYALLEAESLNSHPFSSSRRESVAATKKPGPLPGIGSGPRLRRSFVEGCPDRSSWPLTLHPPLRYHHHPHAYIGLWGW